MVLLLLLIEPPETTQAHSLWVAIEQNYSSTHDIALLLLSDFSCVPLPLGYNINLFSISRHFQILSASCLLILVNVLAADRLRIYRVATGVTVKVCLKYDDLQRNVMILAQSFFLTLYSTKQCIALKHVSENTGQRIKRRFATKW